jgi:methylglutaconyl-CoA hydratase
MTESRDIQFRVDPPAATIVLNREGRRNALDLKSTADLLQLFSDCHGEKRVRAIILTGAGSTFCSGTDLKDLQASYDETQALQMFENWQLQSQQYLQLLETMLRFPKPILAAVNGPVVGIGLALMLASDYVVASEKAFLVSPESRLGLSASLTAPLLAFRGGTAITNRILLTGEKIDSGEASRLGLVHETVNEDMVWARSFELAKQFATGARESQQMTKQMINDTIGESLLTQLSVGAANMAAARITDAAKEGVSAFLEKRDPNWD